MPTPHAAFGPTLAFAEQTLTAVLHHHLDQRQIAPATWYTMQLVAIRGPGLAREELIRGLEESRTLTPDTIPDLLDRLEAEGLIHGAETIDLTAAGKELHRSTREYVTGPTHTLLSQFDTDDIATTVRTLQAITKHAQAELAAIH